MAQTTGNNLLKFKRVDDQFAGASDNAIKYVHALLDKYNVPGGKLTSEKARLVTRKDFERMSKRPRE